MNHNYQDTDPDKDAEQEQTAPVEIENEEDTTVRNLQEEWEKLNSAKEDLAKEKELLEKKQKSLEEREEMLHQKEISVIETCRQIEENQALLEETRQKLDLQSAENDEQQKQNQYQERTLQNQKELLATRENSIQKLEDKLHERERILTENEIQYHQKVSELMRQTAETNAQTKINEELSGTLQQKMTEVINRENQLAERESTLRLCETTQEENLKSQKLKFEAQLQEERIQKLNACNLEIAKKREDSFAALQKEQEAYLKSLSDKEIQLKKLEQTQKEEQSALKFEQECLATEKGMLQQSKSKLSQLVENGILAEKARIKAQQETWTRELQELSEKCREAELKLSKFERITQRFGDDPQMILDEFRKKQDEITSLRQQILNFDTSKANNYDILQRDNEKLSEELENYKTRYRDAVSTIAENDSLRNDNLSLANRNQRLEQEIDVLKAERDNYSATIKRLSSAVDPSDREQRISEINKGILPPIVQEMVERSNNGQPQSEIEWLNRIESKCKEYGIVFPHRILYAFHTALKISDWSTITVLAGVSGTGKSELPRLYSLFGGIQFINVPVQPNWDSKESMLGYFNSIDNRFEAQDVLRFLAQCTDDKKYGSCMAIILLDEMNLAHVELYFAEFLSKLEERRGKSRSSVPEIEVKLGSGMEPYGIKMKRNILWTGTMNQDETTNSLSDKVLDRGIVINFPRPTELISRNQMKVLNSNEPEPLLQYKTWRGWVRDKIGFQGKQAGKINSYRNIVNSINCQLEKVGRALGHRVWQSIEYYIANYPTVIEELEKIQISAQQHLDEEPGETTSAFNAAVKTAFEDQIVQKIMPKLRGIETSGKGEEALDNIMSILRNEGFDSLEDDFINAKELGYGQFMWNSAKYIEKSEEALKAAAESAEHEEEASASPEGTAESNTGVQE